MEEKIDLYISNFHKDQRFPQNIVEISELPFRSFDDLKNNLNSKRVVIELVANESNHKLFKIIAPPILRTSRKMCYWAIPGFVLLAFIFGLKVSSWYFLLLLGAPFQIYITYKIYEKVILDYSLVSERVFCFLYSIGQIKVFSNES